MKLTEKHLKQLDSWAVEKLPTWEPYLVRQLIAEIRVLREVRNTSEDEIRLLGEEYQSAPTKFHEVQAFGKLQDIAVSLERRLRENMESSKMNNERTNQTDDIKIHIATILSGIWSDDIKLKESADKAVDAIVSTITSLQHQLHEAREETEKLKERCEHKSQQVDSQVSLVSEMQFQIASITEENKRLRDEAEVSDSLVLTLQEEVKTLTAERDEARKELAELRSAPGIDEVDEILRDVNSSMFDNQERLASITRRAIASRDEVVRLLKKSLKCHLSMTDVKIVAAGEKSCLRWSNLSQQEARRILEIAEGE